MAAREASFLSLFNTLKRGLLETQETTATVSIAVPPQQRRQHKRYRFKWVKALLERPGVPAVPCYVEDLSVSGCRLAIEPAEDVDPESLELELARAKTVAVVFEETPASAIRVFARLCHLNRGFMGSLILGIQFLALSEAQRQQLETVLRLLSCRTPSRSALQAVPPEQAVATFFPVSSLKKMCLGKELSQVLVRMGAFGEQESARHVEKAGRSGQALDRYLLNAKAITDFQLCQALALQTGLPVHWLEGVTISARLADVFSRLRLLSLRIVPFEQGNDVLGVAAASPLPPATVRELEEKCGKPVLVYMAPESRINQALSSLETKRSNERRFARHKVSLPVTFSFCASDGTSLSSSACTGTALDISEGGFKIEGPAPGFSGPDELLRRGAMVQVVFSSEVESIRALCYLRYILPRAQSSPGRSRWILGLQVAELAEKDSGVLRGVCASSAVSRTAGHGEEHSEV